ncbi:hypothetical protein C5B94_10105 [Clavibacter michiganensis]|uniref:hypothetical protein n=1 Tax=Clavibacter michiganensis TaxID=28447 RepID=UPI000CE71F02|nr:hypothetical protein [Clavibacter michiganensis]PPF53390.1 hypothetical protein C5B94_10105 [Clavibacter michiganensis]
MSLLETMRDFEGNASWAVWQTDDQGELTGEMAFPMEQAAPVVHGRAMIVSLNPGSAGNGDAAASEPMWGWANFHSARARHNDRFLAAAFVGTDLWGAYMADLHPDVRDSIASNVPSEKEYIELAVGELIRQARLLGEVERIVAVGGASFGRIARHLDRIEREIGLPAHALQKITHYSAQARAKHKNDAAQYRALIHGELNLG